MKSLFGIGTDIVEVSRFDSITEHFLRKVFTEKEIDYCDKKNVSSQCFAARFAAKEAVVKAFSFFGKEVTLNQIEIQRTSSGVEAIVNGVEGFSIRLSISHEKEYAIAFAVVVKD